ncbi:MAG: 2Fe-2S iron-sulfur cluster-binding protein [Candidatus Aminicenantales bacterium]
MVKLFIDKMPVEAEEGATVLQAAEKAGISIPHLCFHKAFIPEGSCRMCLVEIEGLPKLELACSTRVREGMKVHTQSEKVSQTRKSVLEFLLAEHPLDCPICDKAGECRLQDYYAEYGLFEGEFREEKIKKDKKVELGKGLILDRERCILCTRCVRFLREITGTQELGVFNRGLASEISVYNGELVNNNYSGNLVQLCPVGAITHKDFRFKIRTWFLQSRESICPLCSRGCSIYIESHPGFARFPRKKRVYRIQARENQEVNGYWICDLGRFGYSCLNRPASEGITLNLNHKKRAAGEEEALGLVVEKVKRLLYMKKTGKIAVVATSWLSNEELFLIRKIFAADLKASRIYLVDPPDGESDSFLLTPERSPNRRGARELGFESREVSLEEIAQDAQILFVFGNHLTHYYTLTEIQEAFAPIDKTFLFSPERGGLDSVADIVFPTCFIAEKGGSLTNVEGRTQHFSPALEPEGSSQPEWKLLLRLGEELRLNFGYYHGLRSPAGIFNDMVKEIPFFGKQ